MKQTIAILFLLISTTIFSQNLVEFRGVERTGHYNETGLLKQWTKTGPKLIYKIKGLGKGYSQPIFFEGKIFVSGIKEDTIDILSAYNLKGELLWETPYGRSWTKTFSDSRSTPTFENGKLYISSGTGQLNCIGANSGKIIWAVDVIKNYDGEIHKYGDAESPLVLENSVVFVTGGNENTMVAFNKNDGSIKWKTKSLGGAKSYASPVVITHNNREMILVQTTDNLISISPENGEIIWSYNLIQYHTNKLGIGGNTNPPLYFNNEIFVTSGYNHFAVMLSLSENGNSVQLKWKNDTIDNHHGGVVLIDGNIYGANWQSTSRGNWVSVNWETGIVNWETKWINKGSIITADGLLYLYEERKGNVALVEPSPTSLKIISTFKVKDGVGPHWAHPAIYNGMLFIRHGDILMVYDIKDK